ncbi:S-methyl-5-thioribose kinase [Enterococcus hulanensis]|uniref:S-methyl-5-thioribose kinase n=1 Tax=Enterococcus hulanensis TaxID=2559929 RepID=A0ABU3F5F1_9ENTE|nr:S-methyl-5-thioribose kinase [Enterococcus hulanensis]MDT2602367.1 S-methyl-5-thioribose kinase [Enterococcus hulanensis]MDT2611828.1 S-methyl-5-thioribose kinase [Enterococcus hulanensis]MDT2618936.1 S-methyl-5-thioribose kinase [Enterococcus hulanensis]MDT2630439.1 S-methyl-5-thioribose kinase [Enterococcus hulanensis]MDT2657925.1 S-methyl-5-thioribose kinase [Enterococcus hulanensis]
MKMTPRESAAYQEHFLMDTQRIKQYVMEKLGVFPTDAPLTVTEIGDGNINYVFRVVNEATQESLIIKQADVLLRSSGRPLAIDRNRIEAEILRLQNDLAPQFVPEVYYYDQKMHALTMEDVSDYQNMRYELIDKKVFPNFSEEIAEYLSRTLLLTSDLVLDRGVKKQRVKEFINPEMCDISEDLVFTEPYDDYKQRNILTPGNERFVRENLYENEPLQAEVALLRNNFMNNAQSLLHGDLHTGSIFINPSGLKVIDPEFAFYGPAGYDIGNVLAHLYFPMVKNLFDPSGDPAFHQWSKETIAAVYDQVQAKLSMCYDEAVTFSLYRNHAFKDTMLQGIMADAAGYAGTEIIRRVVGDSKVKELSLIAPEKKIAAEQMLITQGIQLIINRRHITSGGQLVDGINALDESFAF